MACTIQHCCDCSTSAGAVWLTSQNCRCVHQLVLTAKCLQVSASDPRAACVCLHGMQLSLLLEMVHESCLNLSGLPWRVLTE